MLKTDRKTFWLGALLIVLLTLAAYSLVWHCGFIWDDDDYVTQNLTLRDLSGLKRIWFDVIATPQYYPLVHTTFWTEYHLWGLNPLGYHLVNVFLHALSAILLWRVLKQLQLPGAWLAASIFAVHPVNVESVVWVTERKNVLCGVFYFAAALAYLRFERMSQTSIRPATRAERRRGETAAREESVAWRAKWFWYGAAFLFFVGAMLSKTVACSLPAALLLVCWWKKGKISWREIFRLLPFFAVGIALGLVTAWVEKHHVGATGPEFALTFLQRCLIASRALCFYAAKLVWPAKLTFIYPRWEVSVAVWWQWLFPAAVAAAISALWFLRHRIGRGPLIAVLFFAGTLFPALGFVNVYPMRYSFVADHFQYLAGVGLIVLAAAGLSRLPQKVVFTAVPVLLGVLTWQQTHSYFTYETLMRDTIDKNPACWMAHNNLGQILKAQGRWPEAREHYRAALKINSHDAAVLNNAGFIAFDAGRLDEAITYYRQAIMAEPNYPVCLRNLGSALLLKGEMDEAVKCYRMALSLSPKDPISLNSLASALSVKGEMDEAIELYRTALEVDPTDAGALAALGNDLGLTGDNEQAVLYLRKALKLAPHEPTAHYNLGVALGKAKLLDEAIEELRLSLKDNPDFLLGHKQLGLTLRTKGKPAEATKEYLAALRLKPDDAQVHYGLGIVLMDQNQNREAKTNFLAALQSQSEYPEAHHRLGVILASEGDKMNALLHWREAVRLKPDYAKALNDLAWTLATDKNPAIRNGAEAVRFAELANTMTRSKNPNALDTLAAAYAQAGRYPEAVTTAQKAAELATAGKNEKLAEDIRARAELYRTERPYRE